MRSFLDLWARRPEQGAAYDDDENDDDRHGDGDGERKGGGGGGRRGEGRRRGAALPVSLMEVGASRRVYFRILQLNSIQVALSFRRNTSGNEATHTLSSGGPVRYFLDGLGTVVGNLNRGQVRMFDAY